MPTFFRSDDKPIVQFDPRIEISPFQLLRRLKGQHAPLLVDIRSEPSGRTFAGSSRHPGPDWSPPEGTEVVLFDEDGAEAYRIAERLQAEGHSGVKALFGGLELYLFALDPEVVGEETCLVEMAVDETGNRP